MAELLLMATTGERLAAVEPPVLIEHEAMPHLADKLRGKVEDGFAAWGTSKSAGAARPTWRRRCLAPSITAPLTSDRHISAFFAT
jgi:hypothetical protein